MAIRNYAQKYAIPDYFSVQYIWLIEPYHPG